ncbi:RNA helicase [Tulasnella sp. 408]|nr:RNA helicase [Tulasnella sp. 408]
MFHIQKPLRRICVARAPTLLQSHSVPNALPKYLAQRSRSTLQRPTQRPDRASPALRSDHSARRTIHPPHVKRADISQRIPHYVESWVKSADVQRKLAIMGLTDEDIDWLLLRFRDVALDETSSPDFSTALREKWALDFLEDQCHLASTGRETEAAFNRTILSRFLSWASTQPGPPAKDSPPPSSLTAAPDNITTFSPYYNLATIRHLFDLQDAPALYPKTRRMKRKVILHVGPTNSGKTYNALVALANAHSGVYAGPLRLLAHEIFDRLNKGLIVLPQVPGEPAQSSVRICNLVTGEEQRIVDPEAPFASMTVEMLNPNVPYDVAVLDEVQMIADPERGAAWTKAILGLRVKELHLCGEERAVGLVKSLLEDSGDELVVHRYERLTALTVSSKSLQSLRNVKPGDCVVAFSRQDLFTLKYAIEKKTGLRCAMAYGGLPPEIRAEQAQLFNDPDSGYDVMVASDAVGMGLNLKIKRIVFSTLTKWDGRRDTPLTVSATKQIGGRAGRFGLHEEDSTGLVTTLREHDMNALRKAMAGTIPPLTYAYLEPSPEAMAELATLLPPTTRFEDVYNLYQSSAMVRAPYRLQSLKYSKTVKRAMEIVNEHYEGMPTWECMNMLRVPFNYSNHALRDVARNMAHAHTKKASVPLKDIFEGTPLLKALEYVTEVRQKALKPQPDSNTPAKRKKMLQQLGDEEHTLLRNLETCHKALTGYLWMSYRVPAAFSDRVEASDMKEQVERGIDFYLTLLAESQAPEVVDNYATRRRAIRAIRKTGSNGGAVELSQAETTPRKGSHTHVAQSI